MITYCKGHSKYFGTGFAKKNEYINGASKYYRETVNFHEMKKILIKGSKNEWIVEILKGDEPVNLYLDLEKKLKEEDANIFQEVYDRLDEMNIKYVKTQLNMRECEGMIKHSVHVHGTNAVFKNKMDIKNFIKSCFDRKLWETDYKMIDLEPYKDNQQAFRCVNCIKPGEDENSILKPENGSKIGNYIITIKNDDDLELDFFDYSTFIINKNSQSETLKCNESENNKKTKRINKKKIIKADKATEELTTEELTIDKDYSELYKLSEIIDDDYIDNYKSWIDIIWSLRSESDELIELAREISKRSNKYKEQDFLYKWNQFRDNHGVTIATYYYYAKESDYDKFMEIVSSKKEFKHDDCTDTQIAKLFMKLFGYNYRYSKGNYYYFNGIYWVMENDGNELKKAIQNNLGDFYRQKKNELISRKLDPEIFKKLCEPVNSLIKKVENTSSMKGIFDAITTIIKNDHLEWELNPYVIVFNNKVFDLKKCDFIEPNRDDNMCMSTGYDFIEPTKKEIETLKEVIKQIFPIRNERKLYLTLLSTSLLGKHLEKFTIANGNGGNGKGVINELALSLLGNYGYVANNAILLKPIKDGANPEIANMNFKRLIIYREPDTSLGQTINCSTIKELTGGDKISARLGYSNNTDQILLGTHILECNEKPSLNGKIGDAELRRLIDIPFRSTFVDDVDKYKNSLPSDDSIVDSQNDYSKDVINFKKCDHVYKADNRIKGKRWKFEHRSALFCILVKHLNEYLKEKETIDIFIPKQVRYRTMEYLTDSDEIITWFDEVFEKTNDKTDILSIKYDIYMNFKESDVWSNMAKPEKRKYNQKYFVNYISSNIVLRSGFKNQERSKSIIDKYNKMIKARKDSIIEHNANTKCNFKDKMHNVLVGYTYKKDELQEEKIYEYAIEEDDDIFEV